MKLCVAKEAFVGTLSKRSTIYFEPAIHQALRQKAAVCERSVSQLVNEAAHLLVREDREDLAAFDERANEPDISYEALLDDLKRHGKL